MWLPWLACSVDSLMHEVALLIYIFFTSHILHHSLAPSIPSLRSSRRLLHFNHSFNSSFCLVSHLPLVWPRPPHPHPTNTFQVLCLFPLSIPLPPFCLLHTLLFHFFTLTITLHSLHFFAPLLPLSAPPHHHSFIVILFSVSQSKKLPFTLCPFPTDFGFEHCFHFFSHCFTVYDFDFQLHRPGVGCWNLYYLFFIVITPGCPPPLPFFSFWLFWQVEGYVFFSFSLYFSFVCGCIFETAGMLEFRELYLEIFIQCLCLL